MLESTDYPIESVAEDASGSLAGMSPPTDDASDGPRTTDRVVGILVPMFALLALVAWAFASPVGASPDDDYHMTSIWCGQGLRDGLCEAGEHGDERRVPAVLLEAPSCYAFNEEQSASCGLSPEDRLVNTDRGNFNGDYPPLYYGVMSVLASGDVGTSILAIRVTNAVIFVGLLTALFCLLPSALRTAAVWPVTVASVPLGMFLTSSINPSAWAILSGAGLWLALTGSFHSPQSWRRWALSGLAVLLAVIGGGARSDAAVYAGLAVIVALVLTFERSRRWFETAAVGALIIGISLVFFFTAGQSSAVSPADAGGGLAAVIANLIHLPSLWVGALGTWGLGWLDTAMPPVVWVGSVVAFSAFAFTGLRRMDLRKAVASGLVVSALVAVPLYVLVKDGLSVGADVQPRYIYPLLIMLAGVTTWVGSAVRKPFSATQWWVITVLLLVANSVALHTNLRRYVTGMDVQGADLDAAVEWWWPLPFGPMWVWGVGSLAFTIFVGALTTWSIRRRPQPTAG